MIKTVIFDIGNVLVDFSWKKMLKDKGLSDEVYDRVAKATVLNPLWREIDRGVMTYEEVLEKFVEADKEMEEPIRKVFENTRGIVTKRENAIPWICTLKEKGLRVLVLSNFGEKVLKDCQEAMDFLPFTDGGILSYQEKLIKPDPKIYQLLLERYQLKAEECVFIDDLQENIDAAISEGIHGIVYKSYEQANTELNKLLEEI